MNNADENYNPRAADWDSVWAKRPNVVADPMIFRNAADVIHFAFRELEEDRP